jgi:hypothetical protein
MSPLQICIVLHYYYSPEDWRDGEWNAGQGDIVRGLAGMGLLELDPRSHPIGLGYKPGSYRITERGRIYVEALKAMPLPVQVWQIPTPPLPSHNRGIENG